MGVDGGAGNAISMSEIQSFYGGSNPISLSEYYRNGSLVPGDQVAAQSNTSGTADQTIGEFAADVTSTSTFSGSLGSMTARVAGGTPQSYTVQASDAVIQIIGDTFDGGGSGGGNVNVQHNINGGGTISQNGFDSSQNGAAVNISYYTGPVASGATGGGTNNGSLSAGDVVNYTSNSGENGSGVYSQRRATVTTHDVDFTNNGSVTITTTSGSTGGAQSYTAGQTRKVKDDQSTSNYTLGYDAVLGNTNVPASGTINMDVFNAPGTATP